MVHALGILFCQVRGIAFDANKSGRAGRVKVGVRRASGVICSSAQVRAIWTRHFLNLKTQRVSSSRRRYVGHDQCPQQTKEVSYACRRLGFIFRLSAGVAWRQPLEYIIRLLLCANNCTQDEIQRD